MLQLRLNMPIYVITSRKVMFEVIVNPCVTIGPFLPS